MIQRLLVLTVLIFSQVCLSQTDDAVVNEQPAAVANSVSAAATASAETVETPAESSTNELVIKSSSNAQSAVAAASTNNRPSGVVTTNPASAFMGLVFLLLLIAFGVWVVRRTGGSNFLQSQNIKIVSALSLGVREKIVLVDVGNKQILLGVAPGRISHLQSFDEPVVDQAEQNDFSSKLKLLLNKQGGVK